MLARNNVHFYFRISPWPLKRGWILQNVPVNKNKKTIDTAIVAAVDPTLLDFITRKVEIFQNLLKREVFENLIYLLGRETLPGSFFDDGVNQHYVIPGHGHLLVLSLILRGASAKYAER